MIASERFERAAVLGVAVAEETRRLLRRHLDGTGGEGAGGERASTVVVDVPYPDAAVVTALLDVAAECFGERGDSIEEIRQAALETLLQLAGFDAESQLNRGELGGR
ncbi:hypothetical protein ETD86_21695 [Nonomuraea turkmeniaca]|uniref:Uncharacterized protein n=1 Tax=Nonomuraea turkmeniaca TaxID=103838 RepID=A0A5S4FG65_9ACTN|nr:hypothetical protein [Nonomuraea turkmeniaca]TMR18561.1 hypothetical protein ETD86_21695 [Nonomuraea turkmeniaca]